MLPALDCPRLLALEFTDIILGASGEANLKGASGDPDQLCPLGEDTAQEIAALRALVEEVMAKDWTLLISGVQFRVARRVSVAGPVYYLRRAVRAIPTLKDLGMRWDVAERLLSPDFTHGLVAICGQMSSGKTTTACAAIADRLAAHGGHATTIEDPPELPLHGPHGEGLCYQFAAGECSFSELLVDQMRNAGPKILFLGELRRNEDAVEALRASINGHLVFVTYHATNVADALLRLDTMCNPVCGGMTRMLMAQGVKLVIRQRLEGLIPKRRLVAQSLWVDSKAIQATIHDGRYMHLEDAIEGQARAALNARQHPGGMR